jgi:hypothetical protein
VSPSIDRTYFPSPDVPLVITNLSMPSEWSAASHPAVSATVTNISDRPAIGQLILQVGHVGDLTPWKDPTYSFPTVTFTAPADSSVTIPVSGDPSMRSGKFEVGVYVHDRSHGGQFLPGDQVFAKPNITFDGAE